VSVTKDAIQQAMAQTPFKPFALRFTDGSLYSVPHPDFIHITPNGRTAIIIGDNGDIGKIVDIGLITALDFQTTSSNG
jgi:hypothetical protein